MERRFLYLVNPVAGTRAKKSIVETIKKKSKKEHIAFDIVFTPENKNYAALKERIKKENISDVVVAGGDGTVSEVVAAVNGTDLNYGIIPCGSGNGLALAAGISRNINKALATVFKGRSSLVDGFRINNRFSCMLSGLGFDAQVARDFSTQTKRGLSTYIRISAKNFFQSRSYPFTIHLGNATIFTDAFFISIANSNQFGNYFTIAPKASLSDGLLDVVIVKNMNKIKMAAQILYHIRMGRVSRNWMKKSGILYIQTPGLEIENPSMAPLHIDGEPSETSAHFKIDVIPDAFRLIQP